MADLSGRVDTLESQVAQLFQLMLNKLSLQDASGLQQVVTQSLNQFQQTIDNVSGRTDNLEMLYSSLVYSFNSHVADFTGHTGMLTGQGVHGHPTGS